MKKLEYDIVISGAGYVGLTLACLLAKNDLRIAIVNKGNIDDNLKMAPDLPSRLFAIAAASMEIFEDAGISKELINNSQPINQILICDYSSKEQLAFMPSNVGMENFGYMIEEIHILKTLISATKRYKNIDFYSNLEINNITNTAYYNEIKLSDEKILSSKLLIAAEGKYSKIREMLGIATKKVNYHQDAIVCDIKHEIDHKGVAVEKFLPTAPFAILPKIGDHESCVVWTDVSGTGKLVSSMKKDDVEYLIRERFNGCLGDIKLISKVSYFPLSLMYAKEYTQGRAVLCGDALHSIHPIAGQGLNLGLRDVQVLANLVKENIDLGLDIGAKKLLTKYNLQREFDINLMINSTHNINGIFSSNFLPIKLLRKAGLKIINNISPLKNYIMKYASGYKY